MPSRLLLPGAQVRLAGSVTSDISHILSQCPSDIYVLVTQPGVSALDYESHGNAPALARYMIASQKPSVRSSASVAYVAGLLDTNRWQEVLEKECGASAIHLDTDSMIPTRPILDLEFQR
jgi:hypothetical protein